MFLYALTIHWNNETKIKCSDEETTRQAVAFDNDLYCIMWAHAICLVLFTIKKCFSSRIGMSPYVKITLVWAYCFTYIYTLMFVTFKKRQWNQIRGYFDGSFTVPEDEKEYYDPYEGIYNCVFRGQVKDDEQQGKLNQSIDVVIRDFRSIERAVFYGQALGIFLYLVQSSIHHWICQVKGVDFES